jgi:hypothetical protein
MQAIAYVYPMDHTAIGRKTREKASQQGKSRQEINKNLSSSGSLTGGGGVEPTLIRAIDWTSGGGWRLIFRTADQF